jgi:hypothetical protein
MDVVIPQSHRISHEGGPASGEEMIDARPTSTWRKFPHPIEEVFILAPTIIRYGVAGLLAAGALATGTGTASATTLTPDTQQTQTATGHPTAPPRNFCDDFNHRGDPHCRGTQWTWDPAHQRWNHRP